MGSKDLQWCTMSLKPLPRPPISTAHHIQLTALEMFRNNLTIRILYYILRIIEQISS